MAIQYKSDYPEAHNNLAFAFHSVGLQDLAIQLANKALELKPDYAGAYNNLGMAYNSKGMYDDAELEFQKALEIHPDLVISLNNLGITYRLQEKIDESIAVHKKALALDSLNVETYNSLGLAHMSKGEINTSIKLFQKVLQIAPSNAVAHNNLAYAFYDKNNYSMAIQHAKAAERFGLKITDQFMSDLEKSLDPAYFRVRHILVKTQSEAEEIIRQIQAGANFVKLAIDKSLDKNTAHRGGDFGYFKKGDLQTDFENAILNAKVGELSQIVKTDLGFHLFQRLK